MPLLKIFTKKQLTVSATSLAPALQKIWNVPPTVLKVLVLPVHDEASQPGEDIYIDVRAKAKPERTKVVVDTAMKEMSDLFKKHGLHANIRVELYEPSLQSAYYEPPSKL